jgi:hypothetical protein
MSLHTTQLFPAQSFEHPSEQNPDPIHTNPHSIYDKRCA